ncbi:methyltransferase [Candidatus Woesearchaeota archaeon]|nr:methyltransferase [Candidatus Woesearchaeota archaeon]
MKKPVKKVLYGNEERKYYWSEGDLHTEHGIMREKELKDGKIKTHLGDELWCMPASFIDQIERIERGPAIMQKKDIGLILANIPIDANTKIVDAGTGCGLLAAFLARISKKVTSYDNNKKHLDIAKRNMQLLAVKYKLKIKDIYKGIDEKNLDVITLDLPEPWRVLPHTEKSLKCGGSVVAFLPHISQVEQLVTEAKEKFIIAKVCEVIEREWIINPPKLRPKHQGLMHTAFLVFLRKI